MNFWQIEGLVEGVWEPLYNADTLQQAKEYALTVLEDEGYERVRFWRGDVCHTFDDPMTLARLTVVRDRRFRD